MTGRVTNADKHRLIFRLRLFEGFVGPGIPVDGILRVLKKIWRSFVYQPVRVLGSLLHDSIVSLGGESPKSRQNFIGSSRATVYNRAYLNNKEEHNVSQ
jgi:hypothetical protein